MAKYSFIPWVREGLVQAASGLSKGRLHLTVRARVTDASRARSGDPPSPGEMFLFGPGDVTGLDASQVIRRDPPEGTTDFEPNHFAFIEFDRPDLPWMFSLGNTSAAAGQLRPWICLVVVEKREGAVAMLPATEKSLPVLEIKSGARDELPDLAEAWAWAHAQVVLAPGVPAGTDPAPALGDTLQHSPHRTLSRLICPRKLRERTNYYACVVPTYRGGCQAGMGLPVNGDEAAGDAWPSPLPDGSVKLPVYCHWEFSTSTQGDFKSLVLQLEKKKLGLKDVGTRQLDINQAGYGLPADDPLVDLEGALTPDASASLKGPTEPYKARLAALSSGTAAPPLSVLPPPLYGTWHAAQRTIPDGARDRAWLRGLNSDPRYRVAAGLGAQIVRDQQEQLMTSAWDQLRGARDGNQLVGQAQLAVMAGTPIYVERVSGLDATAFLLASTPMASRVTYVAGGVSQTAEAHVRSAALPAGTTSAQFRRLLRSRGSVAKRFGLASKEKRNTLVEKLNTRQLLTRPDIWPSPTGMVSAESLVIGKGPCGTDTSGLYGWAINGKTARLLLALTQILMSVYDDARNGGQFDAYSQQVKDKLAQGRQHLSDAFGGFRKYLLPIIGGRDSDFLNGYRNLIDALKAFLEAVQLIAPLPISIGLQLIINELNKTRNSLQSYQFGQVLQQANEKFEDCAATPEGPILPPLDIEGHKGAIIVRIDPGQVIPAILGSRIDMPGRQPESLDFIRACPDFPAPMYRELAAQSQDWLLPGLQNMPSNSVALVQSNARFIESFMVGLNHEMSRELYWRGFPTDQRGTYFRQFWDPSGRFPVPVKAADVEAGKDIPPIHLWKDSSLGSNLGRSATGDPATVPLVLLIRGLVLRRFPRAQVTLVKAQWQAGRRVPVTVSNDADEAQIRYPLFSGDLPADVSFRGFRADREVVVGSPDPNTNTPGWFVVFEQQATEPRFGLEAMKVRSPLTWRDLAWDNVSTVSGANANVRLASGTTDFGAATPTQWHWEATTLSDSAQIASIALRRPVRVCIHASELIDLT